MTPHPAPVSLYFPFPHNKILETPFRDTQNLLGHFDLKDFRVLCILHVLDLRWGAVLNNKVL